MDYQKHIAAEWEVFESTVIHPDAPPMQRREMCRAFYAGVSAIISRIVGLVSPEEEVTEEDTKILEDIQQELLDWAIALLEGRA